MEPILMTATTTTGIGTGLTVTVTVASGDFSTVTIVAKGQNYRVGDPITIPAVGGGSGRTITVIDVDGQGVVSNHLLIRMFLLIVKVL